MREHLQLGAAQEAELLAVIDGLFSRHERLWQESKHEAIQALSAGFADKMARVKTELSAKDTTVSSISRYFEALVEDLTDKAHRDPKTKLMNFSRFTEQLESFLALEQRGSWCAVGLVDITGFKRYNDALGHAVGDRIIERVAQHPARAGPVRGPHRAGANGPRSQDLHARFGGDEFCFLIPDIRNARRRMPSASASAKRSNARLDVEDERLVAQPVHVDVGVVCLWLGRVAERRFIARRLAAI